MSHQTPALPYYRLWTAPLFGRLWRGQSRWLPAWRIFRRYKPRSKTKGACRRFPPGRPTDPGGHRGAPSGPAPGLGVGGLGAGDWGGPARCCSPAQRAPTTSLPAPPLPRKAYPAPRVLLDALANSPGPGPVVPSGPQAPRPTAGALVEPTPSGPHPLAGGAPSPDPRPGGLGRVASVSPTSHRGRRPQPRDHEASRGAGRSGSPPGHPQAHHVARPPAGVRLGHLL